MNNLVWCILHEEMVHLEEGAFCQGHTFIAYEDREIGLSEFDFHCAPFPLAHAPPPENDWDSLSFGDWQAWIEVNQPSEEEILISDLNAVELMEELESP